MSELLEELQCGAIIDGGSTRHSGWSETAVNALHIGSRVGVDCSRMIRGKGAARRGGGHARGSTDVFAGAR